MKKAVCLLGCLILLAAVCAAPAKKGKGAKVVKLTLPKNVYVMKVGPRTPYKTIEAALERVADTRDGNTKRPLAICIEPGDYVVESPLSITRRHASKNSAPLYLLATDFANKPRLIAGKQVTKWKKVPFNKRKDVWCADVKTFDFEKIPEKLNYNGVRLTPARWPNIDPSNPYKGGRATAQMSQQTNPKADEIYLKKSDIRTWANPTDARVKGGARPYPIASMTDGLIELAIPADQRKDAKPIKQFTVENMAEELDTPGEWYYDPRMQKVYLIPPDASDPNKQTVTFVVKRQPILKISHAANCIVAGLEVAGSAGDGIAIEYSDKIQVRAYEIHDIDDSSVFLQARDSTVADCDMYRTRHGVFIHNGHGDNGSVDGRMNTVVENNYIHHGRGNGAGVWLWGQGVRISHNLIHDFPNAGIKGFGRFCEISYNRIRHVMLHTADYGAIYDNRWSNGVGTHICYNWISDSIGYNNGRFNSYAVGIYLDECSGGLTIYGNLVKNSHIAGIHLHNARWSTISNNVFITNGEDANIYTYQMSIQTWDRKSFVGARRDDYVGEYRAIVKGDPRWRRYPSMSQDPGTDEGFSNDGTMIMGVKVYNNIVYYPEQWRGAMLSGTALNLTTNFFDRNVYWLGRYSDQHIRMRVAPGKNTWDEWQKAGQDRSAIIADPLFRNPAKDDYRLKKNSPAFKLGFWELPYKKMGLKVTRFRPVLPTEAEGLREHPEWLTDGKKQ